MERELLYLLGSDPAISGDRDLEGRDRVLGVVGAGEPTARQWVTP